MCHGLSWAPAPTDLWSFSYDTNNTFDVGQKSKRYKNRSKTGGVTTKGISYFKMPNCIKAKMVINANPRMIKIMPTPIYSRFSDFVQSLLGLIF